MILATVLAATLWTAHPSDGVTMNLTPEGNVTRFDFDFHGHGGYAIARKNVDLDLPPNYQFKFRLRGETAPQNLEFKLIDASGDNVWWLNRRDFVFPREWTTVVTKKRQISFAWGPIGGGEIQHVAAMEIVVTAGSGGKGTIWFEDPVLEPLPLVTNEIGGLIIECADCSVPDALQERVGNQLFVWLPDAPLQIPPITGSARKVMTQPPTWAPTENDFWSIVAKNAPRGEYPRYLLGEQAYWTVVGADGAEEEALIGEDGAVEPFKSGESIEPFLIVDGKRFTWADVAISHSLEEGDLPIPSVTWKKGDLSMTLTAAVSSSSMLQLRYRVRGNAMLELQVRPFQVNPSTQFLNTEGGVARLRSDALAHVPRRTRARKFEIDVPLKPGAKREPFEKIAAGWRKKLNRVAIDIVGAPEIGDTIRANLAYTFINRDGAALEPGARSYDRAWIRDGALMSSVLLRLGHAEAAKAFAEWFAPFQYENGKVPCCVDRRGADPVPENDSHGQLIFLVAEIYRFTRDIDFVRRMWPHVDAAARYIDQLRRENHGEFEGLVTESISHEGYSAKPVHSYWDDVFALKGVEDAAYLAGLLGHDERRRELEAQAADFRRDLESSIRRVIEKHRLDYVPASVELADFDPTSTSIAFSPLGVGSIYPERELKRTYERYFANLARPRVDYTPYEMRNIGALFRMGERNRALQLVDRYLADRRPAGWKQWAEVVRTEYRKAGFIGDMPHTWIASDFVRAILDAIAYEREDGTLVIGAGVPKRWLPLHVGPLPTSQGVIDVHISRDGKVDVKGGATKIQIAFPVSASNR